MLPINGDPGPPYAAAHVVKLKFSQLLAVITLPLFAAIASVAHKVSSGLLNRT